MKKILLFFTLFISLKSFGQYPVNQKLSSDSTLVTAPGAFKSRFINKVFTDTAQANTQRIKFYDGSQIYTNSGGGQLWLRDSTLNKWVLTGGFNTSIGSGYKIAVNGTNDLKDIVPSNGLTGDSATAGQVGVKWGGGLDANTTINGHNTRSVTFDSSGGFFINLRPLLAGQFLVKHAGASRLDIGSANSQIKSPDGGSYLVLTAGQLYNSSDGLILQGSKSADQYAQDSLMWRMSDTSAFFFLKPGVAEIYGGTAEIEVELDDVNIDADSIRTIRAANIKPITDSAGWYMKIRNRVTGTEADAYWPTGTGGGSTNIYNTDGTLTGNRTLTGGGNNLSFTGVGTYNFDVTTDFNMATIANQFRLNNAGKISLQGVSGITMLSVLDLQSITDNVIDTSANKPLARNTSTGAVVEMNSWAQVSGGSSGITVGTTTITSGTSTRIPFNDAGVYGEDAGLTYNKTTDALAVVGPANIQTLRVGLGLGAIATNTAVGFQALNTNTSGSLNTAFGYRTLDQNTTGYYNTAIGHAASLLNQGGALNTAVGESALYSNLAGNSNVAVGVGALQDNLNNYNVAVGASSLRFNTNGYFNMSLGGNAMYNNLTGINNAAVGYEALYDNTTGSNNIAIGYNTGKGITTGGGNVIIGPNVTGLSSSLANNIIIANGAAIKLRHNGTDWTVTDAINTPTLATPVFTGNPTGTVTSGTYTPTLTNVANVSASTAYACQYMRVGNTVTVSGMLEMTVTAGGPLNTEVGISLPIASAIALDQQVGGTGASPSNTEAYAIKADPANDRARIQTAPAASGNRIVHFHFTYQIL